VKCCEMLRTFLFVLMLLSPSSMKLIFQHNFEILDDPTRYFRRNVFRESKEDCQNTADRINYHFYTSLKRKATSDPDTNANIP